MAVGLIMEQKYKTALDREGTNQNRLAEKLGVSRAIVNFVIKGRYNGFWGTKCKKVKAYLDNLVSIHEVV